MKISGAAMLPRAGEGRTTEQPGDNVSGWHGGRCTPGILVPPGYGFGASVDSHETNCTPPLRLTQTLWNSKSTVLSLPFTVTS